MLKTTDYKVTLENEHYSDIFRELSLTITDHAKMMRADALLGQVRGVVEMKIKSHNMYHPADKLIFGEGSNHIWISQQTTGDRVILISYKLIHRMNLQAN